jgi:hypothetical protein
MAFVAPKPVQDPFTAIPDIVNGVASAISPLIAKAAISAAYKWPDQFGAFASFLLANPVSSASGGGSSSSSSASAAPSPSLLPVATSRSLFSLLTQFLRDHAMTLQHEGVAEAKIRSTALVLAAIRLGAVSGWSLRINNLKAVELAPSNFAYDTKGIASGYIAQIGAGPKAYDGAHPTVSDDEVVAASELFRVGVGLPGLVATSLAGSGHHYLGQAYFEKYLIGLRILPGGVVPPHRAVSAVLEPVGTRADVLDLICHKALHPVDENYLILVASDRVICANLAAAKLANAAVRLPITASGNLGLSSVEALLDQVAIPLAEEGGSVQGLSGFCASARAALMKAASDKARSSVAAGVRAQLIAAGGEIAYCVGIYQAMLDETGAAARSSLLRGYFLKSMRETHEYDFTQGFSFWRAHASVVKARDAKGLARKVGARISSVFNPIEAVSAADLQWHRVIVARVLGLGGAPVDEVKADPAAVPVPSLALGSPPSPVHASASSHADEDDVSPAASSAPSSSHTA